MFHPPGLDSRFVPLKDMQWNFLMDLQFTQSENSSGTHSTYQTTFTRNPVWHAPAAFGFPDWSKVLLNSPGEEYEPGP